LLLRALGEGRDAVQLFYCCVSARSIIEHKSSDEITCTEYLIMVALINSLKMLIGISIVILN